MEIPQLIKKQVRGFLGAVWGSWVLPTVDINPLTQVTKK